MKRMIQMMVVVLGALALNVACGTDLAPRELLDARDAYNQAKHGPATKYALAELETAKQALQDAEAAFRGGDEQEVKDLSYIAERKAQLAEAAGELQKANRRRAAALQEREEAQKTYRKRTKAELTAAQRKIQEERRAKQELSEEKQQLSKKAQQERAKRLAAEKKAAAALASLEELAKVKEDKRGVVITLSGAVLFATGKYTLLPIAREKLNEVAKALEDQGYKKIIVEGHTDSRGGESSNMLLSERRANAVRSHLVGQGITPSKITAVGRGESQPVAPNDSSEGRANNRRVELIVTPE